MTCCKCSSAHSAKQCPSSTFTCCFWNDFHPAGSPNYPIRSQEPSVNEVMNRNYCTNLEAVDSVKQRSCRMAAVVGKLPTSNLQTSHTNVSHLIDVAVQKSVSRAVRIVHYPLFLTLGAGRQYDHLNVPGNCSLSHRS